MTEECVVPGGLGNVDEMEENQEEKAVGGESGAAKSIGRRSSMGSAGT